MAVVINATNSFSSNTFGGRSTFTLSNGQMWATDKSISGTIRFYYSNDTGATWAQDTGATISDINATGYWSITSDSDDNVFILYARSGTYNDQYAKHGTVSGNVLTWSGTGYVFGIDGNLCKIQDIVAFKIGTDSYVAGIYQLSYQSQNHWRVVKWNGTSWSAVSNGNVDVTANVAQMSLDFHHTGDGKTVKDSTPHLYVGYWDYDNRDYYFIKINYSAGPTWSGPTARRLIYNATSGGARGQLRFDGTRSVMAFLTVDTQNIRVWERDAADTTSTDITPTSLNLDTGGAATDRLSIVPEKNTQDVYFLGIRDTDNYLSYAVYDRSAGTWDADMTLIEATTPGKVEWFENERGGRTGWLTAFWQPGTSIEDIVATNAAPNAPTWQAPADSTAQDVAEALTLDWVFNDPDPSDTQSAYTVRRTIGATVTYWNGSTWDSSESGSTKISSTNEYLTLAASWGSDGDANHKYAVKTWDASDAEGAWSSEVIVVPSAKDNPTVTDPTADEVVVAATYLVEWTVATQTKKLVKVYADSGGSPAGQVSTSGVLTDTTKSYTISSLLNGNTYHVGVTTYNDEGLASTEIITRFSVSYATPTPPIVGATGGVGYIDVTIENPGGAVVVDHNEVYRRRIGDWEYTRVATDLAVDGGFRDYAVASGVTYEYKARAVASNGAYSEST